MEQLMVYLTDVVDAYQQYFEWLATGRINGDEGVALREDLVGQMKAFFFDNGESFDDALRFANANSAHGWMRGQGKVGVKVEVDDYEEVWAP
jgi:hypothetical protein